MSRRKSPGRPRSAGRRKSPSRSRSAGRRKSPSRRMTNYQRSAHESRSQCAHLSADSCGHNPNCHYTRNKKTPCRAKSGVRKGTAVYQGPLMQ